MKKAIVLLGEGFEDSELVYPYYRLQEAGYEVDLVGLEKGGSYGSKHGYCFEADKAASDVDVSEYDVLILPGGMLPDKLRIHADVVDIVRKAYDENKVIGAICHGPQLLIEADVVKGKKITSFKAVKTDLINAGAEYEDAEVVVDGNLVTSRTPADLPAFMREIVRLG